MKRKAVKYAVRGTAGVSGVLLLIVAVIVLLAAAGAIGEEYSS